LVFLIYYSQYIKNKNKKKIVFKLFYIYYNLLKLYINENFKFLFIHTSLLLKFLFIHTSLLLKMYKEI